MMIMITMITMLQDDFHLSACQGMPCPRDFRPALFQACNTFSPLVGMDGSSEAIHLVFSRLMTKDFIFILIYQIDEELY